jgi:hypothetical protein
MVGTITAGVHHGIDEGDVFSRSARYHQDVWVIISDKERRDEPDKIYLCKSAHVFL